MAGKIAIVGRCDNTRRSAPLLDPDWSVWALAWDTIPTADLLFETHHNWRDLAATTHATLDYLETLRRSPVPVVMHTEESDIPASVAYPWAAVRKLVRQTRLGDPYLESSIAQMLAMAILESPERIGIWGVDLDDREEYAYQRPNTEYLIGLAEGRGISVFVPDNAALCQGVCGIAYGAPGYTLHADQ